MKSETPAVLPTEEISVDTVESDYYEMKFWHRFLFPTFFAESSSAIMKLRLL